MVRPRLGNSTSVLQACVLMLGLQTLAVPASGMTLREDLTPFPHLLESHDPEYPVSRWLVGDGEWVTLDVTVDAAGAVTSIKPTEGRSPWTDLSVQALRRWRYAPGQTGSAPVVSDISESFYFEPTEAVYLEDESRIVSIVPQALVPVPFCRQIDPLERPFGDLVQLHVDHAGFVNQVRFSQETPPDSAVVREIAKRWVYRPFVATDGPNKGKPVSVWVTIQASRSCGANDRRELARPDSLLLAQLDTATAATFVLYRPVRRTEQTIARLPERMEDVMTRVSSEVVGGWTVPADSIIPTLRLFLQDERSYRGAPPRKTRRLPEPEFGLLVDHVLGKESISVLVSPKAEVLHLWSSQGMLEVPYGKYGRDFVRLLRHFIPAAAAIPHGP